jgi:hypothetical protein
VERRRCCASAVLTAPVGFPVVRAASWYRVCTRPSPPSSIPCVAPPPAAAHRRRPPPTPRHRQRSCAIRAVGLRSDAPVQSRRPQATIALGSRSIGSRSGQNLVNRSNPAGPAVLRKIPQVFRNSQIYPSTLEVFLQISPFFFILAQNLFKSLQISPYTFPKP